MFDCPSRVARLCLAIYAFETKSKEEIWWTFINNSRGYVSDLIFRPLLRPCIVDGILAPTINQRLTYGAWLHVYAKSRCQLPERMAELTDVYIVSLFSEWGSAVNCLQILIGGHGQIFSRWTMGTQQRSTLRCIWANLRTMCPQTRGQPGPSGLWYRNMEIYGWTCFKWARSAHIILSEEG